MLRVFFLGPTVDSLGGSLLLEGVQPDVEGGDGAANCMKDKVNLGLGGTEVDCPGWEAVVVVTVSEV